MVSHDESSRNPSVICYISLTLPFSTLPEARFCASFKCCLFSGVWKQSPQLRDAQLMMRVFMGFEPEQFGHQNQLMHHARFLWPSIHPCLDCSTVQEYQGRIVLKNQK